MSDRIIVFGGNGVYPPVRNLDEEERQEEAERIDSILKEAREIAAAAQEEKINISIGELEAAITKVVHAELAEKPRTTPAKTLARHKKHLAAFRSWCESYPLPHNPSGAVTVAGFLANMATSGATLREVKHAAEAISYRSRLSDLSDPCRDALVQAVLRYLAKTIKPTAKPSSPKKKEK